MFDKKEYDRRYYQENEKNILMYNKKWKENNPEYFKKYWQKNKEDIGIYNKIYHKNNKEKIKESNRIYYKEYSSIPENINKKKELSNKWRKDNLEHIRKYSKNWFKTKKGKACRQRNNTARRIKIKEILNTLTAIEWIEILKKYKFRCAYCNKDFNLFDRPERDHIIPISKGGNNIKENVVPACKSCNIKKGNKI